MPACRILLALLATISTATVSLAQSEPKPPIATPKPYSVPSPFGARVDPYYWLRDDSRSKREVLDYLEAENAYYAAMSAQYKELTRSLTREMIDRVKQDDSTVPYRRKDYLYYTRYEAGREYPVHARKPVAGGAEQVLVDGNAMGEGKEFYEIGDWEVSPNQKLLAVLEDTGGRRQFVLRFRDLDTGVDLPERIPGLSRSIAWANDDKTVYYVENDPVTLLSTRVKRHVLGTDPKTDPIVYEEKDTSFYLGVGKTGDDRYVTIVLESTTAGEVRAIDASDTRAKPIVLAPRERDVLYDADHIGNRWIVRTDWQAPNFRLMAIDDGKAGDRKQWQPLLPHDGKVSIEGFALFDEFLAINERSEGLLRIRVVPWKNPGKAFHVAADEPAYTEYFSTNAEQSTSKLRYTYTSLTTPSSVFEVDMKTGERTLLKRHPVLGGFDASNYVTERVWVEARDGAKIPVSVVYRKGFERNGTAPLYQYAYGSYGSSSDPAFDESILSLLDRGFVYAIAHIRGGQEMGRAWYDDGKLLKKMNTFTDFVDVTDHLVREKYAARDKVVAMGLSAGGLLMGAVANLAPEKYRVIVAHVPYVDAVTTMLDESIPLVTNEFDEWGNPKQKIYYEYMMTYSPYDNVKPRGYPALYVTTGLNDSQVQYYEPAKWVAKLRANKTDSNPLLFKINMSAGHGGKSGRFESIRETAEEYAFILHVLGVEK